MRSGRGSAARTSSATRKSGRRWDMGAGSGGRLRLPDVLYGDDHIDEAEDHEDETEADAPHLPGEIDEHDRDDEAEGAVRRDAIALDGDQGGHGSATRARAVFEPDEEHGAAGKRHAHDQDHPEVIRHIGSFERIGPVEETAYTKEAPMGTT